MVPALEALARLREGNRRFISGQQTLFNHTGEDWRTELTNGQAPFATILGCSDSRVPIEIVFDHGLGDLFVIRIAGNIIAPSITGSVEFAPLLCNTRLVVVMGHSHCGAVTAAVDKIQNANEPDSPNLLKIIDGIRPSVVPVLGGDQHQCSQAELIDQAVRANVRASANYLRNESKLLKNLIDNEGLLVVGAEYSLETGEVDFFDGVPA